MVRMYGGVYVDGDGGHGGGGHGGGDSILCNRVGKVRDGGFGDINRSSRYSFDETRAMSQ
jgi:hypothetical protein